MVQMERNKSTEFIVRKFKKKIIFEKIGSNKNLF